MGLPATTRRSPDLAGPEDPRELPASPVHHSTKSPAGAGLSLLATSQRALPPTIEPSRATAEGADIGGKPPTNAESEPRHRNQPRRSPLKTGLPRRSFEQFGGLASGRQVSISGEVDAA